MRRAPFGPGIIDTNPTHWEVIMTSNEVTALDRPRRGSARRGLRFLIAALSLSLVVTAFSAMPVLAAETTTTTTATTSTETGYNQKPEAPKEEKKVAPAKEEKEAAPKSETEPAKEVAPVAAQKLPFTGLDLRWVVGMGLLLILAGGISLRVVRRRERHGIGR